MKMVSLQLSKKEAKGQEVTAAKAPSGPRYPYGTQLDFDSEILDKIPGLNKMDVGDYVVIQAVACVNRKNQQENQGEKKRFSMAFQIEEISINKRDDAQAAFDEAVNNKRT